MPQTLMFCDPDLQFQGHWWPLKGQILAIFTPQPLRAVGVLFSPMVSGWAGGRASCRAGGRAAGKSLSGLYLRNRKV